MEEWNDKAPEEQQVLVNDRIVEVSKVGLLSFLVVSSVAVVTLLPFINELVASCITTVYCLWYVFFKGLSCFWWEFVGDLYGFRSYLANTLHILHQTVSVLIRLKNNRWSLAGGIQLVWSKGLISCEIIGDSSPKSWILLMVNQWFSLLFGLSDLDILDGCKDTQSALFSAALLGSVKRKDQEKEILIFTTWSPNNPTNLINS